MSTYGKHLTVPHIRRHRHGRRAVCTALVATLVGAGTGAGAAEAVAVDLRSPDVRDASVTAVQPDRSVDLRSPDARDASTVPAPQRSLSDLRSPDVADAATARPVVPALADDTDGLGWGDGVAGGALVAVLAALSALVVMANRRREQARSTTGRSAAA